VLCQVVFNIKHARYCDSGKICMDPLDLNIAIDPVKKGEAIGGSFPYI